MARKVLGSVVKSKEAGKPDYIKINTDAVLKKGQTFSLESKTQQLKSLEAAVAAGKLTPDVGEEIKERLEKMPDFVRFEIVSYEKN